MVSTWKCHVYKRCNLKYILFLSESLRIAPPVSLTTRICTNTTALTDYEDKNITIEKGTMLLLPIYSIHHDPEIYTNPESFRPERFDENVGGIKKYSKNSTFLAFGSGPRMCLVIFRRNWILCLWKVILLFRVQSSHTFK